MKFLSLLVCICVHIGLTAQGPLDDERVLLQGFYWESYRHGHTQFPQFGNRKWYDIVRRNAINIRKGRFDMIWLPPPSYAGEQSAGYNPKEYFNLKNSYGSFTQHRRMLRQLLQRGIEPVADIVINHRDGTTGWTDFRNPDWGLWSICREDEAFTTTASGVANTPDSLRGASEEQPLPYATHGGTTYAYDVFRDIDHTNRQVRKDILTYLLQLKSAGYRGWRYDMVHGFHARWIGVYNKVSQPTFAVGEYDWDKQGEQRGWIWHSAVVPDTFRFASAVFDFSTMFALKGNKGNHTAWQAVGLIADRTDDILWKQKAVTFLENHDTGFRTNDDGSPQQGHQFDSFLNNHEVEEGYAYILTHPGIPSVYWKHFFDWGSALRAKITALINARKVAGVHSGSVVHTQNNATANGVYAALVVGKKGDLYVRIGGNDASWHPSFSGYTDFREYAAGSNWKVWVRLPGNPAVRQAAYKAALPVPVYRDPADIVVPDMD